MISHVPRFFFVHLLTVGGYGIAFLLIPTTLQNLDDSSSWSTLFAPSSCTRQEQSPSQLCTPKKCSDVPDWTGGQTKTTGKPRVQPSMQTCGQPIFRIPFLHPASPANPFGWLVVFVAREPTKGNQSHGNSNSLINKERNNRSCSIPVPKWLWVKSTELPIFPLGTSPNQQEGPFKLAQKAMSKTTERGNTGSPEVGQPHNPGDGGFHRSSCWLNFPPSQWPRERKNRHPVSVELKGIGSLTPPPPTKKKEKKKKKKQHKHAKQQETN